MFWWHGSAFRALECNEAQEQADPSANTWADVNQPTRLIEEPAGGQQKLPDKISPSIAFKVILLSLQDQMLSLTPSGKSRIIRVRKPVMLKVMKMQPATKTAAKAAWYDKPRPRQIVKVKKAFVPMPEQGP